MGSLCSKSSNHQGGHVVLAEPDRNTVGHGGSRPAPSDPRAAAAAAAERRLGEAQRRGTSDSNPKRGKLAGQLAKQNSKKGVPEAQLPERLVWE